jgi:hypothetical protein
MNPFDYTNAICDNKKQLIIDEASEKAYKPFLTNRGLSYFKDTIFYANQMNINTNLDKKLQFDYLLNSVRRSKRYSKWAKQKENKDLELVQEYYGYNHRKAKDALLILSKEQIEIIRKNLEKG